MKKTSLHFIGFVSLIIFVGAGCRSAPQTPQTQNAVPRFLAGCRHPYYPLREGYRADYESTFDGQVSHYQMRVVSVEGNRVRLATKFTDGTEATQNLFCEDGSWKADGYVDLASHFQRQRVRVETERVSGMLLPKDLQSGSTWTASFDVVMHFEDPQMKAAGLENLRATVKMQKRAVGEESVTVPAGTHSAMKIVSQTTFETAGRPNAFPNSGFQTTEWWVKGFGLMKTQIKNPGGQDMAAVATEISE